jgi:DNA-binding CsgD family transcriptional regulator
MTIIMVEVPTTPNFIELRGEGFTPRECEVMHWIAQGKRNMELAVILGLSPRTIGKHVENAFHKLSANTRTAAVAKAFELLGRRKAGGIRG